MERRVGCWWFVADGKRCFGACVQVCAVWCDEVCDECCMGGLTGVQMVFGGGSLAGVSGRERFRGWFVVLTARVVRAESE